MSRLRRKQKREQIRAYVGDVDITFTPCNNYFLKHPTTTSTMSIRRSVHVTLTSTSLRLMLI